MNPKFVARVHEAFPEEADQIIAVISGELDLDEFPPTAEWIRQCHNRPKRIELKLHALDHITGGSGVEAVFGESEMWPDMEYINHGDTYTTTIVFDRLRGSWRIMSWGDWVEEAERAGRVYP